MNKQPLESKSGPTLVSALQHLAQSCPSKTVYTWLVDGEREGATLSHGELDGRARSIAWKLCSLRLRKKRALLLYGPGLEFIEALFGCLYAGVIAVPAYIPGSSRDHPRIQAILHDADCGVVLTSRASLDAVEQFLTACGRDALCLATDSVEDIPASGWSAPLPRAGQIAYLQYTSGSTAAPKGVMITHANVVENLKYIAAQGSFDESTVSVSWLPHFHDMGLIYGILQPLFTGFPAILFSPAAFLHRPLRWLSAISRYRGTHCGGPNFAYDLCVDRVTADECLSLDLASWRVAFNGAEPVRQQTLERFAEYFAGCGFDHKSFYPVYGLAEASLKVTSGGPGVGVKLCTVDARQLQQHKVCLAGQETESVQTVVGCGRAGYKHDVVIVNPDTIEQCAGDKVGEIWVAGPSIAQGYWKNAPATEKTFRAQLKDGQGPFLRTGDLGFLLSDELFITGRLKDCIIIRGRNHYPQDIEKTVEECHPALRKNGSAAFSIEHSSQEAVVVLTEINRKYRGELGSVIQAIRKAVAEEHELQAFAVVLIKAGSLAKTSSGKIQRQACKARFLQDALPVLEKSVLGTSHLEASDAQPWRETTLAGDVRARAARIEDYLHSLAARSLRHQAGEITAAHSLLTLGMDSLTLFDVQRRIEGDLRVVVPLRELLHGTLGQLAAWIAEHMAANVLEPADRLRPQARPDAARLSFSQEQVWLMQQLFPESCAYNELLVLRLSGPLEPRVLNQAIHEILRRHEILRTCFCVIDGELRQRVQPLQLVNLPVAEMRGSSPAGTELQTIVLEEVKRSFQLDRDPPVRFMLFKANEQEHFLILAAHHIVCDGASMDILVRELGLLYQAYMSGEESPLPDLPFQYADFAAWQRESLQSWDEQLLYWRQQLAGVPVLELRGGEPRPAIMGYEGGRVSFQVPAGLVDRLKELSHQQDATLFMGVMAAYQVLLSKYSGQRDFAVGTAAANRSRKGTEDLIGFFVNTIALRTRLDSRMNFLQLLNEVRRKAIEGYEHQDVPFVKLVEELHPERDLSRTPIFQAMLVFQPPLSNQWKFDDLKFSLLEVETGIAKFDLTLRMIETSSGLQGFLEYGRDVFGPETIQRMAGHLRLLLQTMTTEPEKPIAQISMLTEAERRQLLIEWNQTQVSHPQQCVHQLFEGQAIQTPDAIAVECEDLRLTYGELERRANQVAHYLKKLGVAPEVRVGICVERSLEMVVGLLGILKAGGVYVPLDPAYPAERLAYMLEDAQVMILLAQSPFLGKLNGHQAHVVPLDDWRQFSNESEHKPSGIVASDNLAYVIYTSGSTGKPKGVMVSHSAFANHLHWRQRAYPLSAQDRFLHKASLSFDIAGWEIFAPLVAGAQLILAAPGGQQDSAYLAKLIAERNVTVAHFNPAMLQAVLEEPMFRTCRALKRVFCGGEAMSTGLQKLFFATVTADLHNQYGPTETTVDVLCWDCRPERPARKGVPIGRPVDNTVAYILDSDLQPVPVDVTGELYIGGHPLARGYLDLAEMTAAKFIPDPFSGQPGGRLFKTGDLVRWRADGNIEFLGRRDRQVKVRGFRIELEEIETALLSHPAMKEVAVVAHQAEDGNQRLVVYLVSEASHDELRDYLKGKLPEYMIPAAWVSLEKLPRTPSGKVDIQTLREAPIEEASDLQDRMLTTVEEVLSGIWEQLLGITNVGAQENFFDMGGHSVLATRLISRVREVFDVELPLRTVFEAPTVAAMAARVESARRSGPELKFPPLKAATRAHDLPLSFAQQQMWLLHQLHPKSAAYNMATALRLEGPLDVEAVKRAFTEIARRHEVLRTRFSERDGKAIQEVLPPAPVDVLILDLEKLPESERLEEAQRRAQEEAMLPFDLACGPMLRVQLLRLGQEQHVLLATLHHIAGDGWSTGILVRELMHFYGAYARKEKSPLPELSVQYADFAVWQREWLQGELLEKQLAYWRERLSSLEPLELPMDHVRPARMSHQGGSVHFKLPMELTGKLKVLCRRHGVTQFMSMLAAFQVMISKYAARESVAVGTPIANRNHAEIEGLIGFFANTLVLETNLSGNHDFAQVLKRVRQVTLDAYQHQDVPFEKLVEELAPQRELSRSPLFQVMLAMQNTEQQELQLSELKVSSFEIESESAKFDLLLTLNEKVGGIQGKLVYARDLYEAATIERMVEHLRLVLEKMVNEPEVRIGEVSLLSGEERQQVLVDWNRTEAAYREERVHELFEEQVRRNPGEVAVDFEGQSLTYEELNRQSNQLAHYLRKMGVGPEMRVGICMERSLEMVVGLLGILKAGGAYVPLDPGYPAERLAYMLEDAQAPVIIVQQKFMQILWEYAGRVIEVDRDWAKIGLQSRENPGVHLEPLNLAYVIYTSGSTGRPKGAMNTHQGLSNRLQWMQHAYRLEAEERVLQKTPFSFDVSVWEFFWPLVVGARLVVARPGGHQDVEYLREFIHQQQITTLHFVPSMLRAFLEAESEKNWKSVRRVICSGEALGKELAQKCLERIEADLHNLYGPTEASIDVTHWKCEREKVGQGIAIGRPIANIQVYALNEEMEPVPMGLAGELYLGGQGLGRGYLGQPELTAERWVPNPFGKAGGERLYRTGDQVRYHADGNLEFLGRNDQQVKVRGHRIELGEIESVLLAHPEIRQAAVVMQGEGAKQSLVAYLVARDKEHGTDLHDTGNEQASGSNGREPCITGSHQERGLNAGELRQSLKEKLPEYMLPSAFVMLEKMPLTPSGKLDRKALPQPEHTGREGPRYVAPRNGDEEILCGIFAEVLTLECVGVKDNFFELGGHSLLATQVISRVRNIFQVELSLQTMFEAPTAAGLSEKIQEYRCGSLQQVPLQSV